MKVTLPLILLVLLCLPLMPSAYLMAANEDGRTNSLFPAQQLPGQQLPGQQLPGQQLPGQQQEDEQDPPITRRAASDIARNAFPGRVVSIRLEGQFWRVRIDQDGAVFDVLVDAQSGRVSRASQ